MGIGTSPRGAPSERIALVVLGVVVLGSGLALKYLAPPAIRASTGGVPYVALWAIVFRFASLRVPPYACAVVAFLFTCFLEILQLWHPSWLESIRGYTLGALVLGTSFDWLDFPAYAAGAVLAGLLLWATERRAQRPEVSLP